MILGSVRWIAKQMNMEAFLKVADRRLAEKGVKVVVIGDTDENFLAKWKDRLSAFTFAGFVPDVTEILDKARMGLIVEATGGGFKLKVLDYIFNRLPALALEGSVAGLPASVAAHIHMAADMEKMVDDIIALCDDFDALNALQDGAYQAAEQEFDWDAKGAILFKAIQAKLPLSESRQAPVEGSLAEA